MSERQNRPRLRTYGLDNISDYYTKNKGDCMNIHIFCKKKCSDTKKAEQYFESVASSISLLI